MKQKFQCDECGLCCRNIGAIEELKEFDIGNGQCKYLDVTTNHCKIYRDRPDICNVEKSFDKVYSYIMSEEEYLALNYEGCATVRRINNAKKGK